jgi:hypothetical protein
MATLDIFILSATLGQQQYKWTHWCVSIATMVTRKCQYVTVRTFGCLVKSSALVSNTMDMSVVWKKMSLPDFRRTNYGVIGIKIKGNSTSITHVSNCLVLVRFFVFALISLFINRILIIVSFLAKLADVVCDKVGISYSPTLVSHCLRHAV